MVMSVCRECGGQASTDAANCPHCGAPNPASSGLPAQPRPQQGLSRSWSLRKRLTLTAVFLAAIYLFFPSLDRFADFDCDSAADEALQASGNQVNRPVRIYEISQLSQSQDLLVCEGQAWWSTGQEIPIRFELRNTDDGWFVYYEAI